MVCTLPANAAVVKQAGSANSSRASASCQPASAAARGSGLVIATARGGIATAICCFRRPAMAPQLYRDELVVSEKACHGLISSVDGESDVDAVTTDPRHDARNHPATESHLDSVAWS